jgi:uncharacterized membrane protein YqaE (UPF0057 family)
MTPEVEHLKERIAQCRFKINIWLALCVFIAGVIVTYLFTLEAGKETEGQNIALFACCLSFSYLGILMFREYRRSDQLIDLLLTIERFNF